MCSNRKQHREPGKYYEIFGIYIFNQTKTNFNVNVFDVVLTILSFGLSDLNYHKFMSCATISTITLIFSFVFFLI